MNPEEKPRLNFCNHILQLCEDKQEAGNLYLGSVGSLKPQVIQHYKLSAVLTVMDSYMFTKKNIKERVEELGIKQFKWVDLRDEQDEDISKHFEECYDFIEKKIKNHNVLVHCQAGVSRSATIVIYYVMKKLKLSLELANKLVVSKRHCVSPNEGFWNILKKHDSTQEESSPQKANIGIEDPQSEFRTEKYPQKFANHILCLDSSVLERGNLFLGQFSILKSQFIKALHIKSVISVVDEAYYKRMKIKEVIEHLGIESYLWLNAKDEPEENLDVFFDQSFQFIEENLKEGNVLVHCQAGVSRSASVVIAYLIKKFKVNFSDALKFVREKRKVVNPNPGFQLKLVEYSEKLISDKPDGQ